MKDPNERRALVAIALCLALYAVWSLLFAPPPPPPEEAGTEVAAAPAAGTPGTPPPAETPAVASPTESEAPCVPQPQALASKTVNLTLSTCGGSITGIELPGYQEAVEVTPWWTWLWKVVTLGNPGPWRPYGPQEGTLKLLTDKGHFATAGRGAFADDGTYEVVSQSPFQLRRVSRDGLVVTKTFTPTDTSDVWDVSIRFSSSTPLNGPFWVGLSDDFVDVKGVYDMAPKLSGVVDGSFKELSKPSEVTAAQAMASPVSWFGVENRYFLAALAPADPTWGSLSWAPVGDQHGAWWVGGPASLSPDQPIDLKFTLYIGPKYVERLAEVGHDLDKAANLGFFGFFSKVLLFVLKIYQSGLVNWGLSIIALTFTVRLIFYPLSARAFKSGKAMQAVQPLLKEIQEKYKDDKEAQTRETMALFQKHKVNPVGGCLPMLLQMPVFFALYSALLHTPDLFHARFLHVQDLSSPDPIGAFPFFMAVGMLLQQRLTPMTGMDPQQQQMMRYMPLIFALFMFGLPAGLSLYYALNTVLSILQQWYNTRSYRPPADLAPG